MLSDKVLSDYFNQFDLDIKNNTFPSNYTNHSNTIIKRVTLKIDVSHTYHSHIIGRYGWNSNLNNSLLKSNQVSISGQLENVEKARKIIRDILPITFTFEIPYLNNEILQQNQNSLFIQQIQNIYNVEIIFRNHYTLVHYCKTTISVKGLTINAKMTKTVVHILMKRYYTQNIDTISVNMYMNMDTKHSSMLNNQIHPENLMKLVNKTTGANIIYSLPSAYSVINSIVTSNQMNKLDYVSNSLKTNEYSNYYLSNEFIKTKLNFIHIYGNVDSVYLARQLITSLLPVALIFDVNLLQGEWLENFDFTNLCQYYEVNLTIRNKLKDVVKSVVIRTIEKNIRSLYIVWELIQQLLLQYTKTYETNNPSWSNSLIYPLENLWSGDMIQSNRQSTEIQSILNRKKKHDHKENYNKENLNDKLSKEQVIMKSTFSSIASSHSSSSSSSSIVHNDQFIKMNILNRNNNSNLYLIDNESNAKYSLSSEHKPYGRNVKILKKP
ncbi:Protein bicaudal C [Schistosoma japonicum]|uniref:Protein bicaudal C n=1 Tax=Schistosoma japonicum TaxID=6182 RepID=A0A4Z2CYE3_SCHJA|nr:Protein bicaudal C [Schistosoma japonicum]